MPDNFKHILSTLQGEGLISWSREDQAWLLQWVASSGAEIELAADLHKKLLVGAKNELFHQENEPALSLKRVAEFLASVAHSGKTGMARTVKSGLQALKIEHRKRGRPKGRKAESHYAWWVGETQKSIEKSGIFSKRAQLRKQHGRNWQRHFSSLIQREQWPLTGLLERSRTPRAYAMHLAAEFFDIPYDQISRACGRAGISGQK
jgi:hypothetical protein